jgi:acetolactate synthase I/II/III large subunit
MRVDEALASELSRLGVTKLFGVPAAGTMKIAAHASGHGIDHFAARHEHAAIGMADGYARLSGRVGVVLVGRGPGLTNGANALITARKARSPVLVIAGEIPTRLLDDPDAARQDIASMQTIDQHAFLAGIEIQAVTLRSAESAVADLRAAITHAENGVPVAVLLPSDVAEKDAGNAHASASFSSTQPPRALEPAASDIEIMADLLVDARAVERPVVLAGRGAVAADALPELSHLASLIGARLATTLGAKGAFDGLDADVGVIGVQASPAAAESMLDADTILAFGASLNQFTTLGSGFFKDSRIVRVDHRPDAAHGYACDLFVLGDAKRVAASVVDLISSRHNDAPARWTTNVAVVTTAESAPSDRSESGPSGKLDPRDLLPAVQRCLPVPRTVVVDVGAHVSFTSRYLSASEPGAFLLTHDYGSVGAAVGIALGAAVARPDHLTVLAIGDGGLMMALADLDTAVRYNMALLVIVVNDGAFGQEVQHLDRAGLPRDVALYDNPSFAQVGEALGGSGIGVTTLEDLDGLDERLRGLSSLLVLDCAVGIVRGDTSMFKDEKGS